MLKLRTTAVVLVMLVGFGLFAQDTPKPPPPTGQLRNNWKKLGLTDDQVKKIYTVQTDYRGKIDALEEQIKKLKDEQFKKEVEVLSDAQKARLKELGEFKDPTIPPKPEEPKKP
jgi:Spy/CpxP family protein refolding chaperone